MCFTLRVYFYNFNFPLKIHTVYFPILMNWISETFTWYIYLFILGIGFFPICRLIFHNWRDQGYAFSKVFALLFISYIAFFGGTIHLIPFTRTALLGIAGFGFIVSYLINRKYGKSKNPITMDTIQWILIEEVVTVVGIFFLAFIRGQEPSIRSLEKFMDFGFINSILRTTYFPAKDMWLSADATHPNGYPINYYYFGHLIGAMLIKLTDTAPAVGYNLILATILGLSLATSFSLITQLISIAVDMLHKIISPIRLIVMGIFGSIVLHFGGNLHTIYLFTSGYPNDTPIPFWQILSGYNPTHYWYPNATRFIPFTIHEFPSYSYVVADLHGHVFDIPFVLTTLALLLTFFMSVIHRARSKKDGSILLSPIHFLTIAAIGMMIGFHYMTNALDGPIYLLVTSLFLFMLLRISIPFIIAIVTLLGSFIVTIMPFSVSFSPFATGIGVNCSPDFLTRIGKIGLFLFEKGNCQISPPWMLFVLWGFFWIHFGLFIVYLIRQKKPLLSIDLFILLLFSVSTLLILVPEFFYIKDIYPLHFRANTMFKLGYQAYMMMAISSTYVLFRVSPIRLRLKIPLRLGVGILYFFILIYPFFSFPSYYGKLDKKPELDGSAWMKSQYPDSAEIVDYINSHIQGQPVILEAQGDSYTDYNHISAYTGVPTVAGWWVHEWLWRGSSDVVGSRIPDITNIYESSDQAKLKSELNKYRIEYIVVGTMEKQKYKHLNEEMIAQISDKIFQTTSGFGALYRVK